MWCTPYIMSDETPMSKIQTLLVDYWSILKPQRPHLALSLIGGAKNFKMEGRKKEIFKNGLISAAKSTNALILTGGNNIGKLVWGHSLITLTKFWQILTTYPLCWHFLHYENWKSQYFWTTGLPRFVNVVKVFPISWAQFSLYRAVKMSTNKIN